MKVHLKSNGGGVVFEDLLDLGSLTKTRRQDNDSVVRILDHRVLGIALGRDRVIYQTLIKSFIDGRLQEVGCDDKNEGRHGITLTHTTFARKLPTRYPIYEHQGLARREDAFHPSEPFRREAHFPHDHKHSRMLNCVEGFGKVKLQ